MNGYHYLALFIKLFCIILVLQAIPGGIAFIDVMLNEPSLIEAGTMTLGFEFIARLVLAFILWNFPLSISKSILSPELEKEVKPLNALELLTVIVAGIGLYVFYYAAADTFYWISYNLAGYQHTQQRYEYDYDYVLRMWTTGIELLLAVLLIARARTVANAILKVTR